MPESNTKHAVPLQNATRASDTETQAGTVLVGYECTTCGQRVREVGTEGRECANCGNLYWDRLVATVDSDDPRGTGSNTRNQGDQ